jgi:hypothetical protein
MPDRVIIVERTLDLFVILDEYYALWAKRPINGPIVLTAR